MLFHTLFFRFFEKLGLLPGFLLFDVPLELISLDFVLVKLVAVVTVDYFSSSS